MKKILSLISVVAALFTAASLHAGPAVVESKNVVQQQPLPEIFGTGFYMALDAGANVQQ
jgi:hypothetical protein